MNWICPRPVTLAIVLVLAALRSASAAPAAPADTSADVFAPMRAALRANRAELARNVPGTPREGELALLTGDLPRARRAVAALVAADSVNLDARLLEARLDLQEYRYPEYRVDMARLARLAPEHREVRRLLLRGDFFADDLESAEKRFQATLAVDSTDPVALYSAAKFLHLTLKFEDAIGAYRRALRHADTGYDSVRALEGLGACWLQKGDKDAALRYETTALKLRAADDGLLTYLADALIKVGRAGEASSGLVLAADLNPFSENAHYFLGNGYARYNYTELRAKFPGILADSAEARELDAADSAWSGGRRDDARARVRALIARRPRLAQAWVQLGSYAYEEDQADSAQTFFRRAMNLCPDYGRARNGVARSLELYRRFADVHRARYEQEFKDAAWPVIPGIEKFVVNYGSLTPRLQKRVALSIEPWKQFVPVLVEGGATFYIKHLHEVLSRCPGLETLKDQRISYDLRLWDDVRGCGGYNTVTGLEDVEGTLLGRYNTVLHELTHQVHGVLTADLDREIQELYRKAQARKAAGEEAFVSLYQASSVFEYIAEGMNSLFTPRRDRFDTREILRERLEARDPGLVAQLQRLMAIRDMAPFYPVAYANAGSDRLGNGRVDEAVGFYRKALERDSTSEEAASQLSYALCLQGKAVEGAALARRTMEQHPNSASVVLQRALAEYSLTGKPASRLDVLAAARGRVDARERYRIDQDIARAAMDAGVPAPAKVALDSVLAYESQNPEGLEMRGEWEALFGDIDSAKANFERAVRVRSGSLGVRIAYATAMLSWQPQQHSDEARRAEMQAEAQRQVDAARLADPEEPRVAMLDGWLALEKGDLPTAHARLDEALHRADWLALAHVLRARVLAAEGRAAEAGAESQLVARKAASARTLDYVYNPRQAQFETAWDIGAWEIRELGRTPDGVLSPHELHLPQAGGQGH